jgi:single-strand DNA-binding protein
MSLASVVGEFGIVTEPQARFSDAGKAWVTFRGVTKERVRGSDGAWTDGNRTFIDVVVFGKEAENLVESAKVGDTVIVVGKMQQREWVEDDGTKRAAYRVVADQIGMSLKWSAYSATNAPERAVKAAEDTLGASVIEEPPF